MSSESAAEERFRHLYTAHERAVYAYCLRRTDREAALDCAAETFVVAWRRIDDVPGDDMAIRWLFRVAHNVIGDHYRARTRRRELLQTLSSQWRAGSGDEPETIVVRSETDAEVLAALGRLRPSDRQVLLLAAWEKLSHSEIAEVAGCSVHAVDQRIHRAIERLAKELRSFRAVWDGMTPHRGDAKEVTDG